MSNFTIGEAWSQAVAFIKANLQTLVITLGIGVVVAALVQYFLVGGDQMAQMAQLQQALRTGSLTPLATGSAAATSGVTLMLAGLVAGIITSATEFAAMRQGLAPGADDTRSLVSFGLVSAVLTLLLFFVVGVVAAVIIAIPIGLVIGGMAAAGGGAGGVGVVGIFLGLMAIVVGLYLSARLSVFRAAMAANRSTSPVFGVKQSWGLTRNCAWSIVGYLLLLVIAGLVVMMLVGGLVGVIGMALGQLAAAILSALFVSLPVAILGTGIVAGIYRTLAPNTDASVFS